VIVTTGECLQSASCADSRARQLMKEIVGVLEGATTEKPGGQFRNKLRITFEGREFEDVQTELLDAGEDE
jgi:hypothetical protein